MAQTSPSVLRGTRALVAGSSGFVGRHLCEGLGADGAAVFGIDRAAPDPRVQTEGRNRAFVCGDMTDESVMTKTLEAVRPTVVFHLAGVLHQQQADAVVQYDAHVLSTIRLFESIRVAGLTPRIIVASSSAVYGATTPEDNPLDEERPLRPLNHYGAGKAAQEMIAAAYHAAHDLWTIRVRAFNLVGPGQPIGLMASDVAYQIALAERRGGAATIQVGNLSPRRDYLDVRDAVRAYVLLAARGEAGAVYNLCGGRSRTVQACVEILVRLAQVPVTVEVDPARTRPIEVAEQVGSYVRLRQVTGWEPRISLETSLQDLLNDWRRKVSEGT